jgi:thiamine-monophosphate kinase
MALGEFDLIQRYFSRPSLRAVLGVGDDAALVAPTPGLQLAIAADTMVEGRHFFPGTDPYTLGWKSLAVNLSDMAAMGANPRWCTLCLTLPAVDEAWLEGFSKGFYALADQYGVDLIGGDTTGGPLAISVQIIGEVEPGNALRRDGAQDGDDVWVSGQTGMAAMAVMHRAGELVLSADALNACARRLDLPMPRVELGVALKRYASSAIDISDGLMADLGHIGEMSRLGAAIDIAALAPVDDALVSYDAATLLSCQLAGGDDYELCFTAAPAHRTVIADLGTALQLQLKRVGRMRAGSGVVALDASGVPVHLDRPGFNHFKTT